MSFRFGGSKTSSTSNLNNTSSSSIIRGGTNNSFSKTPTTPSYMNNDIINAVLENQVRNPFYDYADDSEEEEVIVVESPVSPNAATTYITPPPPGMMKAHHHYPTKKKEEQLQEKKAHHSRTNSANSIGTDTHSRSSSSCSDKLNFSDVPMLDENEVKLDHEDTTKTRYGQMTLSYHNRRNNENNEDFNDDGEDFGLHSTPPPPTTITAEKKSTARRSNFSSMISTSASFDQINTYTMLKILHTAHDFEMKVKELKERGMATVSNSRFDIKRLFKKYTDFTVQKYVWTFLTLLGLLGGLIVFVQDIVIDYMGIGRLELIEQFNYITDESARFSVKMIMWILYNMIFIVFCLFMVAWVAPAAEGSGVPAIKAILTGVDSLKDPVSFKTFFVRVFCLPLIIGANMFVGRVGVVITIGASLADNLLKLKVFRGIRDSKTLRAQMIACGCAMGVGANFGTPGGGVLLALEAIGTYYSLRTYVKSFYVAVIAALTSRLLHAAADGTIYLPFVWHIKFSLPAYTIPDLLSYALLGVFLGLMGVAFVFINDKLLRLRNRFGSYYLGFFKFGKLNGKKYLYPLQNIFIWSILIAVITSIVTFPYLFGKFMSLSVSQTLESLFYGQQLLPENGAVGNWISAGTGGVNYYGELFTHLSIFLIFRIVLSFISVSLPIPAGIYVPLVVMGAGVGRFWGEVMHYMFQNGYTSTEYAINAGGYAIVGAVALSASATHAFSTVFILLEVAGTGVYLPSLMAAIIAVKISRSLSLNIYDSIIKLKGWPALLEAQTDNDNLTVNDIMNYADSLIVFEEKTTFSDLESILETRKVLPKTFPVVNSKKDMFLLGSISLIHLQNLYNLKKQSIAQNDEQEENQHSHDHHEENENLSTGLLTRGESIYMSWEPATVDHHQQQQQQSGNQSTTTAVIDLELKEQTDNQQNVQHTEKLSSTETISLDYQTCPVAISEDTPALIAHLLFSQLRIDDLFVVWMGRLIGQLHKEVLVKKVVESTSENQ